MTSCCILCGRKFGSGRALLQHQRDSPAHQYDCRPCDRHFGSDRALQQHLLSSPLHAQSFNCEATTNSSTATRLSSSTSETSLHMLLRPLSRKSEINFWVTKKALEQPMQYSPAHASPSFQFETCDSFVNGKALTQHLQDSPIHQRYPETPLDIFFHSFPTYRFDASLPPATSYAALQAHEGWRRGDAASYDAWNRYQNALESELRKWYGAENDISAWHALCRAIGINPLPQTCVQCEEAVRWTHVNIVDLIEWGRRFHSYGERVQAFRNVAELQAYTKKSGKIFRNTLDQEDGHVVLRHLLRKNCM